MSGRIVMGFGAVAELPDLVSRLGGRRVLIVTDPGVVKAGICERVTGLLTGAGIKYAVYDRVEPDPRLELVQDCCRAAQEDRCDRLIGLGGGSALDIAKVAAMLLANGGDLSAYFGVNNVPKRGLPTVMIPTTAGTGSEVTPIAVLSDKGEHLKKGIVSDHLYPDVALVDPELTFSLPAHVTAYTGMDTLTHAIEAYTNRHAQPFVDTFALEAVRLVGRYLRRAVADGADREARYHLSLASLYGGLCLGSVNTAAVHALAYPLGGTFDVPHGIANALLLPYVMRFNLSSCPSRFAAIARALGEDAMDSNDPASAGLGVSAVMRLSKDIRIATRLRDVNIPEGAIRGMAAAAMKVTRLLNNNPRDVTAADAEQIYREAY
jgi:alcohol dehydrogenase class IV